MSNMVVISVILSHGSPTGMLYSSLPCALLCFGGGNVVVVKRQFIIRKASVMSENINYQYPLL